MSRTIVLKLNKFDLASIPGSLLGVNGKPLETLSVEPKALFHHYFLAKFGAGIVDTGEYEYERCLTPGPDWRFRGAGIGVDKEAKRNASNELGKGFARWFHYEHLGFTYFQPLEDLLERNIGGLVWKRGSKGDLPDYVCGPDRDDINLLEAKGRYSSVGFGTQEFAQFRTQLRRAELHHTGGLIAVKGFISVARWATEEQPKVQSALLVEDPWTDGQLQGRDWSPGQMGIAMTVGHYSTILDQLRLYPYADAIRRGHSLPQAPIARRGLWECVKGPLTGRQFVGGILGPLPPIFPRSAGPDWEWEAIFLSPPPLYFGVEYQVLRSVLNVARYDLIAELSVFQAEIPVEVGSLSVLRDGSVIGPAEYFRFVEVIQL